MLVAPDAEMPSAFAFVERTRILRTVAAVIIVFSVLQSPETRQPIHSVQALSDSVSVANSGVFNQRRA